MQSAVDNNLKSIDIEHFIPFFQRLIQSHT